MTSTVPLSLGVSNTSLTWNAEFVRFSDNSAGALVFSGRLLEPETATVVRMTGGELLTTDGPFAESKEHLGGFYIIEAADLDAALAWASKTTEAVGQPIEVRPFWEMPDA